MPSQVLQDLATRIGQALLAGPNLALDEATLGIPALGDLVEATTGVAGLTIANASLVTGDDRLTVSGTSFLIGTTSGPATLSLRDEGGVVLVLGSEAPGVPAQLSTLVPSLLGGAFAVPAALAGVEISTISFTIAAAAKTGSITLTSEGEVRLGGLINLSQPRLTLEATGLDQPSPEVNAILEATVSLAGAIFRIRGPIGEGPGAFAADPVSGAVPIPSGRKLLEDLLGVLPSALPDLPTSGLALDADFAGDTYTLRLPFTGVWTIPLGVNSLDVGDVVAVASGSATGLSGRITGNCSLGGQAVQIQAALPGEVMIAGQLASIDLRSLVESIVGPVFKIPQGVPAFGLGPSTFVIRFDGEAPRLEVRSSAGDFGDLVAVVVKLDGDWEAVAGLALPSDWSFSKLAPLLSPLDDVLKISSPRLVIASFESDDFLIPEVNGLTFDARVGQGLTFTSLLRLEGGVLGFVGQLLNLTELPLSLSATEAIGDAEISARLAGSQALLPGVLTIRDFAVGIRPNPLKFEPSAEADVVIFGSELPKFRVSVGAEIGAGTPQLDLVSTDPWVNPLGIPGLTVNQVGLSLQATPPLYGVLGDVTVAGKTASLEAHFATSAPTFIAGAIPDRLALVDVIRDLVGLSLPAALDASIEDFMIRVVAVPTDTIAGEHFDPGLALQGTFGIVGLEMFVQVRIDPASGVFAHAALKKKVNIADVLIISDAAGDGPPSMTLDTTSSEFLKLTGRIDLLGLSQSLDASVDASGFSVVMDQDLGIAHFKLDVLYHSLLDFRASGESRYGIKVTTGAIHLSPGGPSLGELKIDAGFVGTFALSVQNQAFASTVTGGFHWNGADFQIPSLSLSAAPSSLAEIPDLVNETIRTNAATIFAEFLGEADRWLQSLADGLVQGVENAAQVLQDVYHQGPEKIGEGLKNILHQTADQVGDALQKIALPPPEVRHVLESVGFPADEVSHAMQAAFPGIPHQDTPAFPGTNSPFVPHLDTAASPHVDTAASPHIDTPQTPHLDSPSHIHIDSHPHLDTPETSHVDTPDGPHLDVPSSHFDHGSGPFFVDAGTPHGDTAAIPHGDVPSIPHGDADGPHVDTAAIPHGDAPSIPHGDIPQGQHVDIPQGEHVDSPEIGHADTPPVGHLDAP